MPIDTSAIIPSPDQGFPFTQRYRWRPVRWRAKSRCGRSGWGGDESNKP